MTPCDGMRRAKAALTKEGRGSSRLNLQMCANEKRKWKSGVEWEEKRHGWHLFFRFGESVLFFGDAISPNLT